MTTIDPTQTYQNRKLATVPVLPSEDTKHLYNILRECGRPDPTEAASLSEEIAAVDALLMDIARKIGVTAVHMTGADMAHTGPEWTPDAFQAGEELGTCCTISGGEVHELTGDGVSSPEWFDQIDEIPF